MIKLPIYNSGPTDLQPGAVPQVARRVQRQQGERARDGPPQVGQLEGVLLLRAPPLPPRPAHGGQGPAGDGAHELPRRQAQADAVRLGAVRAEGRDRRV